MFANYINDNGIICCTDHIEPQAQTFIGEYLDSTPYLPSTIVTNTNEWEIVTELFADTLCDNGAINFDEPLCETCAITQRRNIIARMHGDTK